jgi:hypothetical protein
MAVFHQARASYCESGQIALAVWWLLPAPVQFFLPIVFAMHVSSLPISMVELAHAPLPSAALPRTKMRTPFLHSAAPHRSFAFQRLQPERTSSPKEVELIGV